MYWKCEGDLWGSKHQHKLTCYRLVTFLLFKALKSATWSILGLVLVTVYEQWPDTVLWLRTVLAERRCCMSWKNLKVLFTFCVPAQKVPADTAQPDLCAGEQHRRRAVDGGHLWFTVSGKKICLIQTMICVSGTKADAVWSLFTVWSADLSACRLQLRLCNT